MAVDDQEPSLADIITSSATRTPTARESRAGSQSLMARGETYTIEQVQQELNDYIGMYTGIQRDTRQPMDTAQPSPVEAAKDETIYEVPAQPHGKVNVGSHKLGSGLDPALTKVLVQSADKIGVTLQTTSGVRTSGNTRSGRHTHGNASDTALFLDGRQLSVANPKDRAIIAQFSKVFYDTAREYGYKPSIGWADHTQKASEWYMGGNVGHFDIASGRNKRPDKRDIYGTYWGNNENGAGAPTWLRRIYGG